MIVGGATVVVLDNENTTKDKVYQHVIRFMSNQNIWTPGEIHSEKAEAIREAAPVFYKELLNILKPAIYPENQKHETEVVR